MKIKTAAYSVSGELLPETSYEVVSSFACDFDIACPEPNKHISLGLWVKTTSLQIEPIYLTEQQRAALL